MGRGTGVRAVGDAAVQIDFKYRGRRYRERLRIEPSARNLKWAAGLKQRIEHEIATGAFDYARHFPESKHAEAPAGASVSDFIDAWLARTERGLEPETHRKYALDAAIVKRAKLADGTELGSRPACRLTRDDINGWVSGLDLSAKRIRNILTPLRSGLQLALDQGAVPTNVAANIEIARAASAEARRRRPKEPFTPDEVRALAATEYGWLWELWAWTGLRTGELIALRTTDVVGDRMRVERAVRLGREKTPKTDAGTRTVALLEPAQAALRRRPGGDGLLIENPATGRPFESDKQVRVLFAEACVAAGVRYRNPYQLRHTFASWCLSAGENPLWVARQMGHRDVLMVLRVYGRWIPEQDPLAGSRVLGLWQREGN